MSNVDKALRNLISEAFTREDEDRYTRVKDYLRNFFQVKGLHSGLRQLHGDLQRDQVLQGEIEHYLAYSGTGAASTSPDRIERDKLIRAIYLGAAEVKKNGEVGLAFMKDAEGKKTDKLNIRNISRLSALNDLSARFARHVYTQELEPAYDSGEQFEPPKPREPLDKDVLQRAAAAAPPAAEKPTAPGERIPTTSFAPGVVGKRGMGKISGSAVAMAATTRSVPMNAINSRMDTQDEAYVGRAAILSAMSGAGAVHRDPTEVLKRAVYSNVSLARDRATTVGSNVVQDMVLTQEAKAHLLKTTGLTAFSTGAVSTASAPVNARDAQSFAHALIRAYTTIAGKSANAKDIAAQADVLLSSASGEVLGAVKALADGYMPGVPGAEKAILMARIKTQADDLRPFSAQAAEGERRIRRVLTTMAPSIEVGEADVFDPVTRKTGSRPVRTVLSRKGGPAELLIIPREVLGDVPSAEERKRLTPIEEIIFDQAAAAKDKHTRANGYYLIARALHIMNTEREVLESKKLSNKERQIIIEAYGSLDKVLAAHPYGHIGTSGDAIHAATAVAREDEIGPEEIQAAREKGALFELPDQEQSQLQFLTQQQAVKRDRQVNDALTDMLGAVVNGGRFPQESVNLVVDFLGNNPGLGASKLKRALSKYQEIDATVLVVPTPEGRERANKEDKGRETNDLENKMLEAAIDIFLMSRTSAEAMNAITYRVSQLSSVPDGTLGSQDVRSQLSSFMKRHMIDEGLFPCDIIKKALSIPRDRTFDERIAAEVRPLSGKMKKFREDMETAENAMYEIIDRADGSAEMSLRHRSALAGIAASGGGSRTFYDAVLDRVERARSRRSADTPSDIILTPRHVIAGALQLVIERGKDMMDRLTADTGTPYAIPMGPTTGTGNLSKGARKSSSVWRAELASQIDSAYKIVMGRATQVGAEIVIPALMRTPVESATYGNLSLGRGRVRAVQYVAKVLSLPEITRAGLGEFVRPGIRANLMTVTVTFPSGQWRYNGKTHSFTDKRAIDAALSNEMSNLQSASTPEAVRFHKEKIEKLQGKASMISIKSGEVAAALLQDAPDAQGMLSQIAHIDDATGVLTITNVAPAFLDLPTRHVNDLVKYNWPKGTEIRGDATQEDMQRLETIQFSAGNANSTYVPASAVTFRPDHIDSPMSPFNTNRLERGMFVMEYTSGAAHNLTRVTFSVDKVGTEPSIILEDNTRARVIDALTAKISQGLGSSQGISLEGPPKGTLPAGADDGIAIYVGKSAEPAMRAEISDRFQAAFREKYEEALASVKDDASLNDAGKIETAKRIATEHAKQQIGDVDMTGSVSAALLDEVRSAAESCSDLTDIYEYAGTKRLFERDAILYSRRASEGDASLLVKKVNLTTGDISIGTLVYIHPMYNVAVGRGPSGQELDMANGVAPPELYGVGKVKKIYYDPRAGSGSKADPEDFKALVADVEFRGDQVKAHGMRGSIRSPNVTLSAVGIAFLRPLEVARFDQNEIRKIDPDTPRRGIVAENYPIVGSAESRIPVMGVAGWLQPSSIDSPRITRMLRQGIMRDAQAGKIRLGTKVRIRQSGHPMSNVVGRLVGFASPAQLTSSQRSTISETSVRPSAVNAIVQLEQGGLLSIFNRILSDLKSGPSDRSIMGTKVVSEATIKQLFKHIDSEITQRYLNSPVGARGYASYAGSGIAKGLGRDEEVRVLKSLAGESSEHIAAARAAGGSLGKVKTLGPEGWETLHRAGIAAHPGNKSYAALAGYAHNPHTTEPRPNLEAGTVFGCSAILRAVLEHAPEKNVSALDVHSREKRLVSGFKSRSTQFIYSHPFEHIEKTYPAGSHTAEASYYLTRNVLSDQASFYGGQRKIPEVPDASQYSATRQYTAGTFGAGAAVRAETQGANTRMRKGSHLRVASPVGTSFSFQLTDKAGDLEYTRLLREEMQIVKEKIDAAISEMRAAVQGAPDEEKTSEVTARCESIIKSVHDRLLEPVNAGLKSISELGLLVPDKEGGTMLANSRDAWLRATAQFEGGEVTAVKQFDVPPSTQREIAEIVDGIEALYVAAPDGSIIHEDTAPVPTDFEIQIGEDGAINITLTKPQPVRDAYKTWLGMYDRIAGQINQILKSSILEIVGNTRSPISVSTGKQLPSGHDKPTFRIDAESRDMLRAAISSDDWMFAMREAPPLKDAIDANLVYREMNLYSLSETPVEKPAIRAVVSPASGESRELSKGELSNNAQAIEDGVPITLLSGQVVDPAGQVTFLSGIATGSTTYITGGDAHPNYGKVQIMLGSDIVSESAKHTAKTQEISRKIVAYLDSARQRISDAVSAGFDAQAGANIITNIAQYTQFLVGESDAIMRGTHGLNAGNLESIIAAQHNYAMQIGLSDMRNIAEHGHVAARVSKDDEASVKLAASLSDTIEDASINSERSQLESMIGFPKESIVKDMITALDGLINSSSQTRGDQICVPLVGEDGKALTKLLSLKFGDNIPDDLGEITAQALEPVR